MASQYVHSLFGGVISIDLDGLILSKECTPAYIEENLNVSDEILYNAILNSVCSSWLLDLDVFEKFSPVFQNRLIENSGAFPKIAMLYFYLKLSACQNLETPDSYDIPHSDIVLWNGKPSSDEIRNLYKMFIPMGMFKETQRKNDNAILKGEMQLREYLDKSILRFCDSKDKGDVDFSTSLFLLDLLNPKFFDNLDEPEQLVIVSNLDIYHDMMSQFKRASGLRSKSMAHDFNLVRCLFQHILVDKKFSHRLKTLVWKKLNTMVLTRLGAKVMEKGKSAIMGMFFDMEAVCRASTDSFIKLNEKGKSIQDIYKFLQDADGLFEAFELDCTQSNLDAPDYIAELIYSHRYFIMLDGMINFQDEPLQDELLAKIGSWIKVRD